MQFNIKSLIGYSIEATDGYIGKVKEFYFEDTTWLIRYLGLKTGNWLSYRKSLIAPQAIEKRAAEPGIFPLNISKEQIRTSLDIDTGKPVSLQRDVDLNDHYAWQRNGGSGFHAGGSSAAMNNVPIIDENIMKEANLNDKRSEDELHLRSTKKIMGYHIHTSDGYFGRVSDFVFDDVNGQIIYLVVDTPGWFDRNKIFLIETGIIKEIQWENSKVVVNISTDEIKQCPVFDKSQFIHSSVARASLLTS